MSGLPLGLQSDLEIGFTEWSTSVYAEWSTNWPTELSTS